MGCLTRKLWRDAISLRKGISAEIGYSDHPATCRAANSLSNQASAVLTSVITDTEGGPTFLKPDVCVQRGLSQSGNDVGERDAYSFLDAKPMRGFRH